MPLYDQHLHSRYSCDSYTDPAANVEQALAKGLRGLTFTEHFDTHPDDWPGCVYDDAAYTKAIDGLREQYGERIYIGKGIEVCYQPEQMDKILDFLNRHEFDLVMLSIHYFPGAGAMHHRVQWKDSGPVEGTELYLCGVLAAVKHCRQLREKYGRVFDALGHMDLAKRYTQRFFKAYDVAPFAGLIDEILGECVAADLTPEINTSALRQGLNEPMPNIDTVRRYARAGGVAMTLGSDSHRAEDIGAGFEEGAQMLKSAGLGLAVFRRRCRTIVQP